MKYTDRTLEIFLPEYLSDSEITHIKMFMESMMFKLGLNAKNRRFADVSVDVCMDRLRDELEEAYEEVSRRTIIPTVMEFADVANFALLASAAASRNNFNAQPGVKSYGTKIQSD